MASRGSYLCLVFSSNVLRFVKLTSFLLEWMGVFLIWLLATKDI